MSDINVQIIEAQPINVQLGDLISVGGSGAWGDITGTLTDQTDLNSALDTKVDKVTGKGLSTEDYTTAEKSKLAGIEAGAQVNTVLSVAGKTGAVNLDKSDVGLGNVDNTADTDKPISSATQSALDGKVRSTATVSSVYANNASGAPVMVTYSSAFPDNSIAQRSTGGTLAVGTPTSNAHAAHKLYVDTADALKVSKSGDTMTGVLNIGGYTGRIITDSTGPLLLQANSPNVSGVEMKNINNGAAADFRFLIADTTNNYFAFAQPSAANTDTIFGLTRGNTSFIFNNGGAVRDMAIGTLGQKSLYFGTANTTRMKIDQAGTVTVGNKFSVTQAGDVTGNNIVNSTTTKNITVSSTPPSSPQIGDLWVAV